MRHVGNAHLNPAVTVAMLLTRRASVIRCLLFIASQFLGAILGAGFAVAVTASQLRTGTTTITSSSRQHTVVWCDMSEKRAPAGFFCAKCDFFCIFEFVCGHDARNWRGSKI